MIGAIVGDIVGSVYEGHNLKSTDFELFHPAARFTDDSVLTVATADALLGDGDYAAAYRNWYHRYPERGYGGNFRRWAVSGASGPYHSYGNGSAMRVSPTAWAFDTLEAVLAAARASAAVTHDHPEGIRGAEAVAAAIFLARSGSTREAIRATVGGRFGYDLSMTCDDIRPGYRFDVSCQGSVPQALVAFLDSTDFEGAIRLAVSLGGDSDTIAAIAGSVAEAFYGGVPPAIAAEALARLQPDLAAVVKAFRARFAGGDSTVQREIHDE